MQTCLGGNGRVAARQDGSGSGGEMEATEVAAARTWIGGSSRAVVRWHQVGSNSNIRSAAVVMVGAQDWL